MSGLVGGTITALVAFVVFALIVYFIGTSLFGGTATPGEVIRALGYAYTPNALGFFTFIPCLGGLAALAGLMWSWVAGVVAVRQAMDFDTAKALLTVVIAAVVVLVAVAILAIVGVGAAFMVGR